MSHAISTKPTDNPSLPKCEHANAEWAPVIFTPFDGGCVEHLLPIGYCETCTATLGPDDFLTDIAWNAFCTMLRRNGYPQPAHRALARLQWMRLAQVKARWEQQCANGILDSMVLKGKPDATGV